jgi:hypothetical protein
MGRHGRERVLRDYSFAGQAERYVELFAELIGQQGGTTHARPRAKADSSAA